MIGLRIVHLALIGSGDLQARGALNLMHWLRQNGHESALLVEESEQIDALGENGPTVITFRGRKASWWLGGKKDLIARLGEWTPDLIHAHGHDQLPFALDLARGLGIGVVVDGETLSDQADVEHLKDPRVAWIIVPSEVHRAHFISGLGLERDRVTVLPYGVDLNRATGSFPRGDGRLSIGASVESDDLPELDTYLAAIAALQKEAHPPKAVLFAPAVLLESLRERLNGAGVMEAVDLRVDEIPLDRKASAIDIFVHIPPNDRIAPLLIEAMAGGRAIVAPQTGWVTELVHDGENGLLYAPGDVAALTMALRGLIANPEKVKALGESSRLIVAERLDLEVIGKAAVELYRSALSGCQSANVRMEGTSVYKRLSDTKLKA